MVESSGRLLLNFAGSLASKEGRVPPLNTIPILGWAKFASHGLKLPTSDSWEQPSGDPAAQQYADGLKESNENIAGPPTCLPIPFFQPQNMNKQHQDSCNQIGNDFKAFHDKMLDAVKYSHSMWKLQAKFKDLKVMAVSAIGAPGCLDGPELESNIKMSPGTAAMIGNEAKYRDAVAKGVSKCFKAWQDKVTVPGLPWYPAFAAFPGPQAPPMPNVPMPLITCISAKMTDITVPGTMRDAMIDAFDQGLKDKDPDKQHEALFDAIDVVLCLAFMIWLASQQVMLVLGKGPIPTFAPPYVPVGPVVAGDNIAIPGHLMA